MARKIVAGNWKMNLNRGEALELIQQINQHYMPNDVQAMCFTPSLFIESAVNVSEAMTVGAQNFYFAEKGAFTGEVSINQLKSVGAQSALIGHSERRAIFHESDELLKQKVDTAIQADFPFIFCCGEPLGERNAGTHEAFVNAQLNASLFHITKNQMKSMVIAYEPVWAIGTGETASSDQAEEMHAAIRSWIGEKYDNETANSVSILYGGSCNENNAKELFSCPNVDGGLIGGASLKAESFCAIIDSF